MSWIEVTQGGGGLWYRRYMALLAKRSPSAAIEWFDKGGGTKAGGPAAVAGKVSNFVSFF